VQRPGTLPLSLLLTPLPRTQTSWLSCDPRWLVLIFDRTRRIKTGTLSQADLLRRIALGPAVRSRAVKPP
jgi:hypothetical protein